MRTQEFICLLYQKNVYYCLKVLFTVSERRKGKVAIGINSIANIELPPQFAKVNL